MKFEYTEIWGFAHALRGMRNPMNSWEKAVWKELVRLLPESWLQTRTVTMNYENILMMYRQRKAHKLNEWSGIDDDSLPNFISWVKTLPYAQELITGGN